METKQKLEAALKDAMRSNNEVPRRTIRMVLSAVKMSEIEKGSPLDDAGVSSILQKEVKSRREAIAEAQKANRSDLIADNTAEIEVLESFLPKQLTEAELFELAAAAVAEVNASSPSDMGKVMKVLMPKVQGRVAGDLVSQAVRKALQG